MKGLQGSFSVRCVLYFYMYRRHTLDCTTVTSYTNMPSVWPRLTNTNIRSDATDVNVRHPFLLNRLLKACFAEFSVIEKGGVRVNVWDDSFTDDLSGGMNLSWDVKYGGFSTLKYNSAHLQVFVELSPPGLLDAVPRPQGLLHLGRSLEHHRVVHIAFIRLLDLRGDNNQSR